MTPAQEAAVNASHAAGALEAREVLTRDNGDIAIITASWTMLATPDGLVTLWQHGAPTFMAHGGAR